MGWVLWNPAGRVEDGDDAWMRFPWPAVTSAAAVTVASVMTAAAVPANASALGKVFPVPIWLVANAAAAATDPMRLKNATTTKSVSGSCTSTVTVPALPIPRAPLEPRGDAGRVWTQPARRKTA